MQYFILILIFIGINVTSFAENYSMPHESQTHEATWLQWPHHHEYGISYRKTLEPTWIAMTNALSKSENVHIIVYDKKEEKRVRTILEKENINMKNVIFFIYKTNDVWIRDNGPIFVFDNNGNIVIEDWGFNGWGEKFEYDKSDKIPKLLGSELDIPVLNLNSTMVNEGGAVELDGSGVLIACKSSIISQEPKNSIRNPEMTEKEANDIFKKYLGVSKIIWLDGNVNDPNDITDFHIDGFAKFYNQNILITMNKTDLKNWGLSNSDITKLYNASNINGKVYEKIYLSLTENNVITTKGKNLGTKGSYLNYYTANNLILMPSYKDPNDTKAKEIIQKLYKNKKVIEIDSRDLYEFGGMIHCVTQQQPKVNTPKAF